MPQKKRIPHFFARSISILHLAAALFIRALPVVIVSLGLAAGASNRASASSAPSPEEAIEMLFGENSVDAQFPGSDTEETRAELEEILRELYADQDFAEEVLASGAHEGGGAHADAESSDAIGLYSSLRERILNAYGFYARTPNGGIREASRDFLREVEQSIPQQNLAPEEVATARMNLATAWAGTETEEGILQAIRIASTLKDDPAYAKGATQAVYGALQGIRAKGLGAESAKRLETASLSLARTLAMSKAAYLRASGERLAQTARSLAGSTGSAGVIASIGAGEDAPRAPSAKSRTPSPGGETNRTLSAERKPWAWVRFLGSADSSPWIRWAGAFAMGLLALVSGLSRLRRRRA